MKEKFIFEPLPISEPPELVPNTKKRKPWLKLKFVIWTLICMYVLFLSFSYLRGNNPSPRPLVVASSKPKNTSKVKTAVYFNYFDSVVFLNDWKGTKVVVSKGNDEYMKQDRLVIKSDGYYFNCYCKDLIVNYVVGDTIP